MIFIYNKTSEKEKRKFLRNNMPKAEIILWSKLKSKQLNGYKFRRQYGIGKFVVDFYCPELKLVVEVDGDSHFVNSEAQEYDKEREVFIQSLGIKFLRFLNTEIYENLDGVLEKISNDHPAPLLSKEGSKGRLGEVGRGGEKKASALFGDKLGQTLVELLLALGIFAFIMTAVFALVFGGLTTGLRTEEQDYATMYAQEGLDAARSIRDTDWNAFAQNGTHSVANAGAGWSWDGTYNEITYGARKFTREITVEDVYRDANNNIFTGSNSANFDFSVSGDYQCEGGTCPSANIDNIAGTAQLKEIISMNPRELTADGNTKVLYHFNLNDGKELALGDLGGVPDANLKGLWHLNDMATENVSPPTSSFSGSGGGTWPYRSPISIKGSTSNLNNYQMLVTMNTAYLISAGKMKSDGSDIRFTNLSGNELDYWIESGINTTATKIWVEVNSILASPLITTIYMYYGNSSATATSSWNNTFAAAGTYAAEITADTNTKGLWRMNNNWNDSSSSAYNGTVYPTGANLFNTTTPKLGAASGQFDGLTNATPRNSQHIELGLWNTLTNIKAAAGSWTYEAWVKTADADGNILNVTDTGDAVKLGVSGGKAIFRLVDYSILVTPGKTATSTTSVNDNTWHHIAGARSGDYLYIYVDGKLEGSTAGVSAYNLAMSSWSPTWVFGGQWDSCCAAGGSRFQDGLAGSIDEIHISNSARDLSWITKNAGVRQVASPAPEIVTVDLLGNNNNGSLYNGVLFPTAGKFSNALSFDGVDDYVDTGSAINPSGATGYTIEAWIKSSAGAVADAIAGWYDGTNGIFMQSKVASGEGITVVAGGGTAYGEVNVDTHTNWVHAALVYDGTLSGNTNKLKLYVNGAQQTLAFGAGTVPASMPALTSSNFKIGDVGALNRKWAGSIDEVAVYNTALSAPQITDHYRRGVAADATKANFATGGTITQSGNYTIHTFTSSGTFTPNGDGNVEYLVVGGGGGGGGGEGNSAGDGGGGGGAGGFRTGTGLAVISQGYPITVGGGSSGGGTSTNGTKGGDSVFSTITATGGGYGGGDNAKNGGGGGSGGGGGGGCNLTSSGGNGNTPSTSPSQGNTGGNTTNNCSSSRAGAGGGGASVIGNNNNLNVGGAGGNGTANSYSGSSVAYSGGGGGGSGGSSGTASSGGSGGGGPGGATGSNGSNGTANTGGGGGGGGARTSTSTGGNGGSGIVIIRYPTHASIIGPITTTGYTGLNQALSFDGTDDYVSVGNVGMGIKSVEFWINNTDGDASDGILELVDNSTYVSIASGAISTNGFTSPTIYVDGSSASAVLSSGWHHVAITTNTAINAASVKIGEANNNYFSGSLDEVAIWDKVLTQADIWDHIGANVGYAVNSNATVKYNINPSKDTSYIDKFKEFIETATIPAGTSIDYQLSTDDCTTMKYWDGDSWENVGGWNDARTINRYFDQLTPSSTICLSTRLNTTDANQTPVLDNVEIKYTTNKDNGITWPADTHTKKVTSRVKWPSGFSFQDVSLTEYLTDWMYRDFIYDTEADFGIADPAGLITDANGTVYLSTPITAAQTYTSAAIDTGSTSQFAKTSWNVAALPAGTTLTLQVRSAPDNTGTTWTAWSAPITMTIGSGSSALSGITNNRWMQYQIVFDPVGTGQTPVLDKITIQAKNLY